MRYDFMGIAAFSYTGTGLLVYAVTGSPRRAALVTGAFLVATGLGWLIRWVQGDGR